MLNVSSLQIDNEVGLNKTFGSGFTITLVEESSLVQPFTIVENVYIPVLFVQTPLFRDNVWIIGGGWQLVEQGINPEIPPV